MEIHFVIWFDFLLGACFYSDFESNVASLVSVELLSSPSWCQSTKKFFFTAEFFKKITEEIDIFLNIFSFEKLHSKVCYFGKKSIREVVRKNQKMFHSSTVFTGKCRRRVVLQSQKFNLNRNSLESLISRNRDTRFLQRRKNLLQKW